jgi:hypothetical protein
MEALDDNASSGDADDRKQPRLRSVIREQFENRNTQTPRKTR